MISPDRPLVLGSASPRRHQLLTGLGIPIRVVAGNVEEMDEPGEAPEAYLDRVVADKLAQVAAQLDGRSGFSGLLVADTIVVIDDRIVGKPESADDACTLLRLLVGRTHRVDTRYALARAERPSLAVASRTVQSYVTLRHATDDEVRRYAQTGEGLDKAGAYAAQGIGAFLIERIEGSYTNVVGLPTCEVVLDLRQIGLLEHFP
jgi:septum formation protein